MAKSPVVIPFSTDGVEIPLKDGITLPTDARGFISVGLDGTTARFVVVDSSGRQVFVGAGVAGTPAGGVVSVQGVAGGTAIPISAASLPLPTGAATETTLASRLADATFTARINTLGQKTMANSTPVVLSSDQSSVPVSFSQPDVVASGTIAANNVSITTTDQGGVGSFSIQITGTWVGTIQFEASVDGTNYVNINARTVNSGTVGVSTTTNGVFRVARPGYQFFRCRSSVWTSGTATVTIRQAANGSATVLTEALPTGANVIGAVTGSGNFNVVGPGAAGAAISGNPVRIGLSDGTNTRNLLGDASGRVIVVGAAADGAAVTGNPVLMAGQDGTNAQSILTDTTGRQVVVGAAADGAAVAGNPVLMAGQDGTNAQSILTDTTGRQVVVGAAAAGAAVTGNPVLMGGSDGTNAQNIRVASDGTVRIDPTGTTTQPISGTVTSNQGNQGSHAQRWMIGLSDGTAFISPATDRTTAPAPFSVRLSDGTAFYDGAKTGQLPSALVGGRLDANVGSWLGATTPTVGQKTMAASIPIVIASDQSAIPVSGTVTATNPSVGTNGTAIPGSSTQVGGSDGTNLQAARVFDADSGAGSQFVLGAILRKSASGGSVEAGTSTDPLRVDPTGTTAQPVTDNGGSLTIDTTQLPSALVGGRLDANVGAWLGSTAPTVGQKAMASSIPIVIASDQSAVPVSGTVTANIGTSGSLALDATLTGGTQKAIVRGGAKGATTAADVTSTAEGADHQALDIQIYHGGVAKDPTAIRALTSSDVVTAAQGTAAAATAPWATRLSDGTAFYDGTKTGQLPSALVGGRLDANVGSWLGATTPTVGQKTMAASIPIVIASDQGAVPVSGTVTANIGTTNGLALDATLTGGTQKAIVRGGAKGTTTAADVTSQNVDANTQALHVYIAGGGGSGGTASNFGAAFPGQGTAGGFFDGTNMQGARVFDADSGAGSQFVLGAILRKSASGGSVEAGTSTDPLRTDPTGTTAQPVTDNGGSLTVDGTVTANQGGTWTVQQGTPPWSVVGAAADGAAPSGNPVLIAGQDGTNVQTLKTDTTGRQEVIGGAANGVAVAGNPVRIGGSDGTLTRDILTDVGGRQVVVGGAADGAAPVGNPVLMAGQDGTNTQSLLTDTTGRQVMVGAAADGAAVTGNPVLMAGQDGTNAQSILTDATGRQVMVGAAADGAAVTGNPVLIAGQDGTNAQSLLTDTSGRPRVVGAAADGAAIAGDPVLIAGQDGTNVQSIRTLTDGTVQVRYKELATFTALATATVVGNNKSMLSIVNASGSTVQVRVLSIHVVNAQTTAVTGVTGTFEVRRCVNHSAGTAITAIETMDSTDAINGSVTVRTNGTITTESAKLLWRALFSTDEWGPGTQDVESGDHIFQTMFPIWKRRDMDAKPILLRANEGLTVKFATNSTAGSFDILVVFTQE